MVVLIVLVWLISLWPSLSIAKRKGFAQPAWTIFAVLFGPVATLFFYVAHPGSREARYLESRSKEGRKPWPSPRFMAYVVGALLLIVIVLAAIAPPTNPAAECHRQYGYDRGHELACLIVAAEAQKQQQDAEIARRWRETH